MKEDGKDNRKKRFHINTQKRRVTRRFGTRTKMGKIESKYVKEEVLPLAKEVYNKRAIEKQIKSELKFLNCQGIKYCVKMADFGSCHMECPTIENRKKKLKKQLKELNSHKHSNTQSEGKK